MKASKQRKIARAIVANKARKRTDKQVVADRAQAVYDNYVLRYTFRTNW